MTYWKFNKLYSNFKNHYDFVLTGKSYRELAELADHDGEFLPD